MDRWAKWDSSVVAKLIQANTVQDMTVEGN